MRHQWLVPKEGKGNICKEALPASMYIPVEQILNTQRPGKLNLIELTNWMEGVADWLAGPTGQTAKFTTFNIAQTDSILRIACVPQPGRTCS